MTSQNVANSFQRRTGDLCILRQCALQYAPRPRTVRSPSATTLLHTQGALISYPFEFAIAQSEYKKQSIIMTSSKVRGVGLGYRQPCFTQFIATIIYSVAAL